MTSSYIARYYRWKLLTISRGRADPPIEIDGIGFSADTNRVVRVPRVPRLPVSLFSSFLSLFSSPPSSLSSSSFIHVYTSTTIFPLFLLLEKKKGRTSDEKDVG